MHEFPGEWERGPCCAPATTGTPTSALEARGVRLQRGAAQWARQKGRGTHTEWPTISGTRHLF
eukprot:scaffold27246_cov114-Isochrysis_galbana.AAC.4